MAKLFATIGAGLDTVDETAQYLKDRISALRWDALAENYKSWHTERRNPATIPPHMREGYISFCKSLKCQEEQNQE